jgi:glycosyltransferase involved in cell wall biosynthesis
MRICFVIEQGYDLLVHGGHKCVGGSETQQLRLARALRMRGHETCFLTGDAGQPREVETEHGRVYEISSSLPKRLLEPTLMRHARAVMRAASAADADVYYVRAASLSLPFLCLWTRANGRTCVYAAANDWDALLDARGLRVPLQGWRRVLYVSGLYLSDLVLAQHEQQVRAFARLGVRARVVANAIDIGGSIHTGPRQGPSAPPSVVAIGRLDSQKRPELIVELARRLPDRRFIVIGGGTPAQSERFVQAASTTANVRWLGHLDPAGVAGVLEGAALLVNTSDSEGFPNTFLEAWLHRVPVVTLTVDPGGVMRANGLGVPAGTIDAMAARVEELLDNPKAREQLGERCRSYVERHHGTDEVVERLLEHVASVLGAGARGGTTCAS